MRRRYSVACCRSRFSRPRLSRLSRGSAARRAYGTDAHQAHSAAGLPGQPEARSESAPMSSTVGITPPSLPNCSRDRGSMSTSREPTLRPRPSHRCARFDCGLVTSNNGQIATNYTYQPFGATTFGGSANGNPYQFTGRENDGIMTRFSADAAGAFGWADRRTQTHRCELDGRARGNSNRGFHGGMGSSGASAGARLTRLLAGSKVRA